MSSEIQMLINNLRPLSSDELCRSDRQEQLGRRKRLERPSLRSNALPFLGHPSKCHGSEETQLN